MLGKREEGNREKNKFFSSPHPPVLNFKITPK